MKDTQRQRHRQREKQVPCRDPDAGLDPGTPRSHPELKADAQPLSQPGVPSLRFKSESCLAGKEHIQFTSGLFLTQSLLVREFYVAKKPHSIQMPRTVMIIFSAGGRKTNYCVPRSQPPMAMGYHQPL